MKKEDYMKLSKERLAELLAERDASDVRIEPIIIEGAAGSIPCYAPGGVCANPQRDCIGCPKRHLYGVCGNYITTTINNWINDGKD